MESNHRPPPYQGGALPTELRERNLFHAKICFEKIAHPASTFTLRREDCSLPRFAAFAATALRALHRSFSRSAYIERVNGAGDGNRTRTSSLEGYSSTIELLPPRDLETRGISTRLCVREVRHRRRASAGSNGGGRWIRTTEGMSQQIYSLPPLAAWVSLQNLTKPR